MSCASPKFLKTTSESSLVHSAPICERSFPSIPSEFHTLKRDVQRVKFELVEQRRINSAIIECVVGLCDQLKYVIDNLPSTSASMPERSTLQAVLTKTIVKLSDVNKSRPSRLSSTSLPILSNDSDTWSYQDKTYVTDFASDRTFRAFGSCDDRCQSAEGAICLLGTDSDAAHRNVAENDSQLNDITRGDPTNIHKTCYNGGAGGKNAFLEADFHEVNSECLERLTDNKTLAGMKSFETRNEVQNADSERPKHLIYHLRENHGISGSKSLRINIAPCHENVNISNAKRGAVRHSSSFSNLTQRKHFYSSQYESSRSFSNLVPNKMEVIDEMEWPDTDKLIEELKSVKFSDGAKASELAINGGDGSKVSELAINGGDCCKEEAVRTTTSADEHDQMIVKLPVESLTTSENNGVSQDKHRNENVVNLADPEPSANKQNESFVSRANTEPSVINLGENIASSVNIEPSVINLGENIVSRANAEPSVINLNSPQTDTRFTSTSIKSKRKRRRKRHSESENDASNDARLDIQANNSRDKTPEEKTNPEIPFCKSTDANGTNDSKQVARTFPCTAPATSESMAQSAHKMCVATNCVLRSTCPDKRDCLAEKEETKVDSISQDNSTRLEEDADIKRDSISRDRSALLKVAEEATANSISRDKGKCLLDDAVRSMKPDSSYRGTFGCVERRVANDGEVESVPVNKTVCLETESLQTFLSPDAKEFIPATLPGQLKFRLAQEQESNSENKEAKCPVLALKSPSNSPDEDSVPSAREETEGPCAFCGGAATQRCSNCRQVFYCRRHCQKQHWQSGHREECKPYKIQEDSFLGRYLVATRDFKAGDVIFKDQPIIVGPKQITEPVCLGCYKLVDGSYRCSKCTWPLCGKGCEEAIDHQPECVVGRVMGSPIDIKNFNEPNHFYEVVTPLRCLALKKKAPKKYNELLGLESHYSDRSDTHIYKENQKRVVNMLRNYFMIVDFPEADIDSSEETIHKMTGIIDVNAVEIPLEDSEIVAVYPCYSLLEHSCTPNTKYRISPSYELTLQASVNIRRGEHLSTIYTPILWGTHARRDHLKSVKYFMCTCRRCADPTELGTHFSALRCPKCSKGYLMSAAPLDQFADWLCTSCNTTITANQANDITLKVGEEIENVLSNPTVKNLEEFIEKSSSTHVHPNHFHLFVARHSLLQLLGREAPGLKDPFVVQKKEALCQEFLKTCTALDPGMCKLSSYAGVALYEYHLAVMARTRQASGSDQVDRSALKKDLDTAKALLQQCIKVLQDEMLDKPEGQLRLLAEQNLYELNQWAS